MPSLFDETGPWAPDLRRHASGKTELSITLRRFRELCSIENLTEQNSVPAVAVRDGSPRLPADVTRVAAALFRLAARYVEWLLRDVVPSATMALPPPYRGANAAERHHHHGHNDNGFPTTSDVNRDDATAALLIADVPSWLDAESVLRLWLYDAAPVSCGEEPCRGHYDPGLCTALLPGSRPGLEINPTSTADTAFSSRAAVDGSGINDARNDGGGDWMAISEVIHHAACTDGDNDHERPSATAAATAWRRHYRPPHDPVAGVLLFNDTLTQVLTGGAAGHLFHRVVSPTRAIGTPSDDHCNPPPLPPRFNLVVELRPPKATKAAWYAFTPTPDESASVKALAGTGNGST